jgi:mono/diheme cytochrome c family protein
MIEDPLRTVGLPAKSWPGARLTRGVGASVAALALAACAAAPPDPPGANAAPTVAQIEVGRRLAERHCASCHAVRESGESRNADAPPLRRLAERYPATLLADAFPQRMAVGHPAMPEFPFDAAEIDALLAYLLSIQERRGV